MTDIYGNMFVSAACKLFLVITYWTNEQNKNRSIKSYFPLWWNAGKFSQQENLIEMLSRIAQPKLQIKVCCFEILSSPNIFLTV